jgi:hypothetical protein
LRVFFWYVPVARNLSVDILAVEQPHLRTLG